MSLHPTAESSAGVPATFTLRRLFSLSGIFPLGAFVVLHLVSMARALGGPVAFEGALARWTPIRLWLEIVLIGLPLVFHAALGLAIVRRSRINIGRYPWGGNWSYALQRMSGIVALFFIAYHLWQVRIRVVLGQTTSADFHDTLASSLSATGTWGVPWVALAYLLGTAAVTLHLAIGVVGFASSFGLVQTLGSTRRLEIACAVAGSALFLLGAATVVYFATGAAPLVGGPR